MRLVWFGFEFRMILNGKKPRMGLQLDDFHQCATGAGAGDDHAGIHELLAVFGVEFVAMAMAFADFRDTVGGRRGCLR